MKPITADMKTVYSMSIVADKTKRQEHALSCVLTLLLKIRDTIKMDLFTIVLPQEIVALIYLLKYAINHVLILSLTLKKKTLQTASTNAKARLIIAQILSANNVVLIALTLPKLLFQRLITLNQHVLKQLILVMLIMVIKFLALRNHYVLHLNSSAN